MSKRRGSTLAASRFRHGFERGRRPHGRCSGDGRRASWLAVVLAACTSGAPATKAAMNDAAADAGRFLGPFLSSDCDPLVPTHCGYPFPSNVWLAADSSTKTGARVEFGPKTLPISRMQTHTSPDVFRGSDGFSPGAALLAHLPGATVTGLPTPDTIAHSLDPDCPTIVIEAETGARVPHWSELDVSHADDTTRAFMIRPVVRLKDATRYIVAIRHVADESGAALPPSPAFRALRDGTGAADASVESRRALYADVFSRLAKAGVPKDDLQLAWDFSTASAENNTRWLVAMRDDALARVGPSGPAYRIESMVDAPFPEIERRIDGSMTVPLYLDAPERDTDAGIVQGGTLVFGPDGSPVANGTADYPFVVLIPKSAVTGTPGALLQYGHGLFNNRDEVTADNVRTLANEKNFVVFGTDWNGLVGGDEIRVAAGFDPVDLGRFHETSDQLDQAFVNALLAMRMMMGAFANDPAVQFGGKSAIDPAHRYYYGNSLGGINGTVYMSLTTDVTRGVLGVSGQPFSLLLNRSADATALFQVFDSSAPNPLDQQLILGLVQMLWDRAEPTGFSPYITRDTLPGTPAHQVLMQVALGDHQVTPLGAHVTARSVGARVDTPAVRSIFGLDESVSPFEGSAIVEYDFGLPPAPTTDVPMTEGADTHEGPRGLAVSRNQIDAFLRTGAVDHPCNGPCDPE